MVVSVSYLPFETIHNKADEFLWEYNPLNLMPIDIERIIDRQFNMHIVPVYGMRRLFKLDACIAFDLTTIYVDDDQWVRHPSRFRFSLAHELSHKLLHGSLLRSASLCSLDDWKDIVREVQSCRDKRIEFQADEMAGRILVPTDHLHREWNKAQQEAIARGFVYEEYLDDIDTLLVNELAKVFRVSVDVMIRRLRREQLIYNHQA